MSDAVTLQAALEGTLVILLGALMRHFSVNRRLGKKRDENSREGVEKMQQSISDIASRTETVLREISSQVGVLSREVYRDRVQTSVNTERMTSLERELSHVRAEVMTLVQRGLK